VEERNNEDFDSDEEEALSGAVELVSSVSCEQQCVDATVFNQHCVTASHVNEHAPKFWHLETGQLDTELTMRCAVQYRRSLAHHNITFTGRHHAELFSFDQFLVYVRKRSTSVTPCVFRHLPNAHDVSVVAHVNLPDSYFCLFLAEESSCGGGFSLMVVREGVLEHRAADMTLLRSIEVPRLSEDIPNMASSAGKKRLLSYSVAVTTDRRYFLIVCPTPGGKTGRYMDLVDLRENRYLQRTDVDARLGWRVLEDGVYYVVRPHGEIQFDLRSVRTVRELARSCDYCCIVESDRQTRSPDGLYGVELSLDHAIHVWTWNTPDQTDPSPQQNPEQRDPAAEQTEHQSQIGTQNDTISLEWVLRPRHCCVLRGHVAEVTCVSWISRCLLVSGSRDNTVRLWSLLGNGSQLCLFHVLGTIDNVHVDYFTTTGLHQTRSEAVAGGRHVVVHCSYAPQRKRAIVLRINNV